MSQVKELHREWMRDDEYREAYGVLKEEFESARTTIQATTTARMPQPQTQGPANKVDVNAPS